MDRIDGYAIFVGGVLHHVSDADTRDRAYSEYAEEVGFDRSAYPMASNEVSFHYIPPTDMEDWEGATADDHPTLNRPV